MKRLVFPYLTKNKNTGWKSSVCIYNDGLHPTTIEYTYDSTAYGGTQKYTRSLELGAQKATIFIPEYDFRYTFEIICNENVVADGTVFGPEGTTTKIPLSRRALIDKSDKLARLVDCAFWNLECSDGCDYLRSDFMSMVKIAAIETFYSSEEEKPLTIFDACPRTGVCSNHPGASHSAKGLSVDVDYYWDGENIDVERQSEFFNDLFNLDENIFIRTHSDIIKQLKDDYFFEFYEVNLIADDLPTHNHKFHAHLEKRV